LGRKQELNIYCPPDLKMLMETLNRVAETKLNYPVSWHFTDPREKKLLFEDKKVEVFSFPLRHRIHCNGFLFREKPLPRKIDKFKLETLKISFADILRLKAGEDVTNEEGMLIKNADATLDPPPSRSFAYCSDTVFDPSVAQQIRGVDLLYHESTFLKEHEERAAKTFHSTAEQAAAIAKESGAKQLLLGHFSARYSDLSPFLTEAGAIFGNCVLAGDGKKLKI